MPAIPQEDRDALLAAAAVMDAAIVSLAAGYESFMAARISATNAVLTNDHSRDRVWSATNDMLLRRLLGGRAKAEGAVVEIFKGRLVPPGDATVPSIEAAVAQLLG